MTAYIVAGLSYGDEGKGATVDYLVRKANAACVVKYTGGHQCAHRVVLKDGRSHVFAQYGAGALAGASTFLGPEFVIEPLAMLEERNALSKLGGRLDLKVHPRAAVTTPYHRALNRIQAIESGRHNTCGVGIGLTKETWIKGIGLVASDLGDPDEQLVNKLRVIRADMLAQLPKHPSILRPESLEYFEELHRAPLEVGKALIAAFRSCVTWRPWYDTYETIVYEGSQGFWLDESYGTPGCNTWATTTTRNARELLHSRHDKVITVGVVRSYFTHHGEQYGLMIDYEPSAKFPEAANGDDGPEGPFRVRRWTSTLLEQLRTSIKVNKVDVLAVNHLDITDRFLPTDTGPIALGDYFVRSDTRVPIAIIAHGPTADDRASTLFP